MIFSLLATIQAWWASDHQIRCSRRLWRRILRELQRRSDGRRESGAFLLGRRHGSHRVILDAVYYDDIAPESLYLGAILFPGNGYGKLWAICRERGLEVVADVHTHPGLARQSPIDRAHPMIAEKGHFAFIVPNYATGPFRDSEIGMYEYQGAKMWNDHSRASTSRYFLRTL